LMGVGCVRRITCVCEISAKICHRPADNIDT